MIKRPRILFDHLPKCGGTSVRELFSTIYGSARVAPFVQFHSAESCVRLFNRYDVVCGHFSGRVLFNPRFPLAMLTIVRDPIDRILSAFAYTHRLASAVTAGASTSDLIRSMTLDEFIRTDHPAIASAVNNWFCIHFADALRQVTSSADLLPTALEAVEHYDLLGLHEDMPETAARICELVGVEAAAMPHVNATPERSRKGELDLSTLRILEAQNNLDLEFHKIIQERFYEGRPSAGTPPRSSNSDPDEFGDRAIRIGGVCLNDTEGAKATIASGQDLKVEFDIESDVDEPDLIICLIVRNFFSELVYGVDTRLLGIPVSVKAGQRRTCQFSVPFNVGMGEYSIALVCYAAANLTAKDYHHWVNCAATITVLGDTRQPFFGVVKLESRVTIL